jgi:type II secretory pathway component PulM
MIMVDKINNFLVRLDKKQFYLYLGSLIGSLVLVCGLIFYFLVGSLQELDQQMEKINNTRSDIQQLLTRLARVKQQQVEVDALLAKDPNFKIRSYVNDLMAQLNLEHTLKAIPRYWEQKLERGYVEQLLDVSFANLNMSQLCAFMNEIEKNPRVYTKKIEIIKSERGPTIDVNSTIATVQPKAEET